MKAARIQIRLDTSEADQVLAILALRAHGKRIGTSQWRKLFATEPYRRLKEREAAIGKQFHAPALAFTDEDFKKFVLSGDLKIRARELSATLERWKKADVQRCAERALAYLPESATIHATVYPVIKPRHNSFVWDLANDPAIFMYLDPQVGIEKLENTVAHELHHIGLGSLGDVYDRKIAALPEPARSAAHWMGAFGEGFAMLAAAGGPDEDPQATSSSEQREQWSRDMARVESDLRAIDAFFRDTIQGRIAGQDAIDEKASSFYGAQGPWYTVGYTMAVTVEKRFGRRALIETMTDPRCLLVLYNRAVSEKDPPPRPAHALWSGEVLRGVAATGACPSPTRP